jgi:hypothetical protein
MQRWNYSVGKDEKNNVVAQAVREDGCILDYARQQIPGENGYLGVQRIRLSCPDIISGGLETAMMVVTEDRNFEGLPIERSSQQFYFCNNSSVEEMPLSLMSILSTPALKKLNDLFSEYNGRRH